METMAWNVKGVETVSQAVSMMRIGHECKTSPQCITRCKPFGHTIEVRRKLQTVLAALRPLAIDSYYLEHGDADYKALCELHFAVSPRRGYVLLTLK